jgi:CRP-like cAMP-binding protein
MRQEATVPRLNRILQRLPDADYDRIAPRFESVALSFKETLYEQQQRIEHMYFVESGVISLVTDLEDGGTIETGTIGNEGVVGVPAFLGMPIATGRAFCQIPGSALRVDMDTMLRERERNSRLAQLVLRVANATMSMLAQTAACNRAHPVEERMARWLLMTHDRGAGAPAGGTDLVQPRKDHDREPFGARGLVVRVLRLHRAPVRARARRRVRRPSTQPWSQRTGAVAVLRGVYASARFFTFAR